MNQHLNASELRWAVKYRAGFEREREGDDQMVRKMSMPGALLLLLLLSFVMGQLISAGSFTLSLSFLHNIQDRLSSSKIDLSRLTRARALRT